MPGKYEPKSLANNIRREAKLRHIRLADMLSDCGFGVNTINTISDNNDLSSSRLAVIADYLNVSADYLLGRTERPEVNR